MTVDALGFVGFVAICTGVFMLSPAAALIVGGAMMIGFAIKLASVKDRAQG